MVSKSLWMVSMIMFSMVAAVAAAPTNRLTNAASCSTTTLTECVKAGPEPVDDDANQPDGALIKDRIDVIKHHYKRHAELGRHAHSCAVAVYHVSETNHDCWKCHDCWKKQKCLASPEAGLAYLAEAQSYHHLFDGSGFPTVENYELKDPTIWDYRFILEGYVENTRCEEAHLYMNLPHDGVFRTMNDPNYQDKQNVRNYFHQKAIFENALPAILHNAKLKKLFVHRVVGFTHASWGTTSKADGSHATVGMKGTVIDPSKILHHLEKHSNNGLGDIFKQAHIMDAVEFDLVKYREDQKIAICSMDPKNAQCFQSNTPNLDNHKVPITEKGDYKRKLHYKSEGITNFLDAMICSLATEYEISMKDPIKGKGAASFRSIFEMAKETTPTNPIPAYHDFVANHPSNDPSLSEYSFHENLAAVMTADDWPDIMRSVATRVKLGMCDAATASTYEKYVEGDRSSGLPFLVLGGLAVPFFMYR